MRRTLLLAALAGLAACGDWPDLGVGGEVEGYPRLVPFESVAAQGDISEAETAAAAEADAALLARAEALRDRAAATAPTPEDAAGFEALRGRRLPGG